MYIRKEVLKSFAVLALAVLQALTVGCGDGQVEAGTMSEAASQSTARAAVVDVKVASFESVPTSFRAAGSLEALRRVSPGTKILGRVDRVTVREGDRVEKGALLARLESRDLKAAVRQAEAAVRMAEAQVENARAQRERMVDLHGRGSVTDKNLEDATAAFHVAEAAVDQAEANLAAVRVTLGYAEVRSPFSGWVVAKHVEAGDMANPGVPFFTIEDLSQVRVSVQVPEAEVVGLERGAPARVTVLDREIDAVIDRIVPSGDPASRTFAVKLLLDNDDATLGAGMFARVSFTRGEREVLRVEESAVITRGQLEGLFVAGEDGRARLRWIRAGQYFPPLIPPRGQATSGYREILSGLEAGERYVVNPPSGWSDGELYEETKP